MTRRGFFSALLGAGVVAANLAQHHVAYVDSDRDPATGRIRYWAVFNGRRYGPYNSSAEAWAKLRALGA